MLHWLIGGSGTGKSSAIINIAKRKTDEGISPLIIVPDQFSFEFDKKLYRLFGAEKYNKADTQIFSRLSETIFLEYGGKSGEYADDLTKSAVIYQAVEEAKNKKLLKFFTRQAEKSGFCEKVLQVIDELKKSNITSEELYEKTNHINHQVKAKAEDISIIYTLYNNILEKNKLKDKLDNISEAAALAAEHQYFKGKTVFIDEFESFPDNELAMLKAIISQTADVYITLRSDNINEKNSPLFKSANSTYFKLNDIADKYGIKHEKQIFTNQYRFKSEAIKLVSSNIFRNKKTAPSDTSNGIKIIEARDFYQEAEFICSEICRLIRDENYRFNDFSIVTRTPDDYSGILEACFKRYHIPYFMDVDKSVMHTSIMLLVSSILEIISARKPDTEIILKYAKTQLLGLNYEQISILENYCYKWNINGDIWNHPFTAEISGNGEIAEKMRHDIIEPLNSLRKKCSNTTGLQICLALYEYFEEMNIPRNISGFAEEYMNNGYEYMAKELKRLWGCLMDILDTAANILNDTKISPSEFKNLINSMLKQNKYSNPPHSLDAVSVSSAQRARFDNLKAVFIIGVNEGIFPTVKIPESLISENDKQILEKADINFSKSLAVLAADEKFMFYKAVSAPSEKLYILYPVADASGNSRFDSNVISSISSMFKDNILHYCTEADSVFYSPTPESAYYNLVQHFQKNASNQIKDIQNVLNEIPTYKEKINYLMKVYQNDDFRIENTELIRKTLSNRFIISATKFETYNMCHFKFFCRNILKINQIQRKDINPIETGNIIHKCLENIFLSCSTKDEFINLKPENIRCIITDTLNNYRNDELGGNFAKSSRFEANYSKIKNTAYEITVHIQEELAQSEFRPSDYELVISEKSENTPLKITTPSGIEVILSGKVDRIDIYEKDGVKYIRIIDYKSRNKDFSFENLYYGIDMQMFLYLYSIISGEGKYKGAKAAGVLYQPYSKTLSDDKQYDKSIKKRKNHKMTGVVLQDRIVLAAMEKEIQGLYIPAELTSKDKGTGEPILNKKSSSCLNEQQFINLEKYIRKSVSDMTETLYSGDISINPFENSCQYCEYTAICGNNEAKRKKCPEDREKLLNDIDNITQIQ